MTQTFNEDVVFNDPVTANDNLKIDGSQNITQLDVEANSTQTEALQQWSENGGEPLARITGDGRLQVGSFDSGAMATDDSLIEAHRDEADTSKPTRGLHLLGEITGTLSNVISWAVQELVLKGTGGISALHSALRVKLTNENTGTMDTGAELRAGDFEVVNDGGSTGDGVTQVTGIRAAVTNNASGYIDTAIGLDVELAGSGDITDAYGIRVADVDQGSGDNFAIHTGDGVVHLGDALEIPLMSTAPTSNPPTDYLKFYSMLDDKDEPQLFGRDSSGDVFNLSGDYRLAVPWTALSGSSVLIEDIPQDGNTLHFQALLRTDHTNWDAVDIRPNDDSTAANYLGIYTGAYDGSVFQVENSSSGIDRATIGTNGPWIPGTDDTSGEAHMLIRLTIFDYATSAAYKYVLYECFGISGLSPAPFHLTGGVVWRPSSNSAVTSLKILPITGDLDGGSQYALWRS